MTSKKKIVATGGLLAVAILFVTLSYKSFNEPELPLSVFDPSSQSAQVGGSITDGLVAEYTFPSGTTDYSGISAPASLNITGPLTVSARIRMDSSALNRGIVVNGSSLTSSGSQYALIDMGNGIAGFRVHNASTIMTSRTSSGAIASGAYYHVVGTYNGSDTTELYINGIRVDTDTISGFGALNSANNFLIGSSGGSSPRLFDGHIENVRVYNRTLSASEISQLNTSLGSGTVSGSTESNSESGTVDNTAEQLETNTPSPVISSGGANTTITPTAGAITYYVSPNGNDTGPGTQSQPLKTIQKCADVAMPGNRCLVMPGQYGRTDTGRSGNYLNPIYKSGTAQTPIVFEGMPGAESNGFFIRGDHFKVKGFTFTNVGSETNYQVMNVDGDYVEISNNTFTGTFNFFMPVMINLGGSYDHAHHNVIRDWVNTTSEATAIQALGAHSIIEYNTIRNVNDIDTFQAFGHDHIFRNNLIQNVYNGPIATHIDFVQVFGNNGSIGYNMLFENNFIDGHAGQIGQAVQSCGPAPSGYNPNVCSEVPGVNGTVTSRTSDTLTDSNVTTWGTTRWTLNEAENRGYIVYITNRRKSDGTAPIYVIKSHTANTLTLMNPNGTVANLVADGVQVGDSYEIRNRIGWWIFR
ncbi:MAG TPA: LamG-like jellyroll fold domain-containing protein, partial [Candidatus Paceibacterota bacterium]